MRPSSGEPSRAALFTRIILTIIAVSVAVGGFSTGCGACAARRDSGIFVEIPDEIIDQARAVGATSITLKIRIRALNPSDVVGPPVLNDLAEVVYMIPPAPTNPGNRGERLFEGRNGLSIQLNPSEMGPWADIAAVVHFAVFTDSVDDVRAAFASIDDPIQMILSCGGGTPCSHFGLRNLNALGAYSLTIERLGRTDADIVLYPLFFDNTDIDPDGDTMSGVTQCVGFLEGDYPWADQAVPACESILDTAHIDCDDASISVNLFEIEPGDIDFNICTDGTDQDCSGTDGPCLDIDGDGFAPPEDCNDNRKDVYPGAPEMPCDNMDQDCDQMDSCPDCDLDDDGYCPLPVGVILGGDCCDVPGEPGCMGADPASINPGAPDFCGNGIDENCTGGDPLCADPDADGDGHCSILYDCPDDPVSGLDVCIGNMSPGRPICCLVRELADQALLAACTAVDDCADWDTAINPSATEVCGNALDDDCNLATADPCDPLDTDMDGFLAPLDCGPTNAAVHPGAGEICENGLDDDCTGGDALCAGSDGDGDGYVACPVGVFVGCDCNDADVNVNPGAPEECDPLDNDCDGIINDGNPEANLANVPDPCYGNPIGTASPPYMEILSEAWRCRIGATVCGQTGSFVCIHMVTPDPGPTCAEDNQCNGRNDVCVPCGAPVGTPDVPIGERDLDGDFCFPCTGADDRDDVFVTAGDNCSTGTDCCDEGSEGGPGCNAGNAPTINTLSPELCSDQTIDNDCDGLGTQICGLLVTGDPCTTGLSGICSGGVFGCASLQFCSPLTADTDGGVSCGTFCNPGAMNCPYDRAEFCDTVGTDDDCDGSTGDVDDETSAGAFVWRVTPTCSATPWTDPSCDCDAGGACSVCASDFWQCTGPSMPTCTPPGSPPVEACGGGDLDCSCTDDQTQDTMSGALCPGTGTLCDGASCVPGCNSDADCNFGNICSAPPACQCNGAAACNPSGASPQCFAAAGCHCGDSGTSCGGAETCTAPSGGDCACGGTSNPTGEACPNSSMTAPDCLAGTGCRCESSLCGPVETCTGPGGDCSCVGTTSPTGEACVNGTAAPDCLAGMGCRCEASVCGPLETCTGVGGDCSCNGTTMGSGEACANASAAPDCVPGSGCRCQADVCGPSETCSGVGGDCECTVAFSPSTGQACPDTGVNPDCFAGGCRCGDATTTCDSGETCSGVGGDCECTAAFSPATGEACPDGSVSPDCNAGVGCRCQAAICGTNETCTGPGGDCSCNGTTAPTGEACVGTAPDCIAGVGCRCGDAGTTCGSMETCPAGDCNCNGTTASTGEACIGTAPDCFAGSGCRCGDSGTTCGSMETCPSGDCNCNGTTAGTGEACTGTAPDCIAGSGCRCGDAGTTCGSMETCNGSSDCSCNGASVPTGEACTGTAPDCIAGTGCRCGDAGTTCGSMETCNGSSDCTCNGVSVPTGQVCTGNTPDCIAGTGCRCGDAGTLCGPMETCNGSSDCACGGTTSGTGEACGSAAAPDCNGSACVCNAAGGVACGVGEVCMAGGCVCGGLTDSGGPVCGGGAAQCIGGVCDCNGVTLGGACGALETCSGGPLQCDCGGFVMGGGGSQACLDSDENPECFPSVGCRCGDATSICDNDGETCSAASGGNCMCVGDSNPTGEACPDANVYEDCQAPGCGCDASPESCLNGFVCSDTPAFECECNSAGDCNFGLCSNGRCDCDSSGGTGECLFGQVCTSTTAGACSCTGGSCFP